MGSIDTLSDLLGVTADGHEKKVMRLLIELGIQFVDAEEGSLLVLDAPSSELVFAMTVGNASSEQALVGQRVPVGKGLTGLAALTHEVQIGSPTFGNIHQSPRQSGSITEPTAVLAAPMLIADELIGVITAVDFRAGRHFASTDALLFGRLASVAGLVVEQYRRLNAIYIARNQQLSQTSITERERAEQEVIIAVHRIATRDPSKLPALAKLLSAAADLLPA